MSPCDRVAEALVTGEPLDAADRTHLEGCSTCQRVATLPGLLTAAASAPAPRPGFSARMMVSTRQRLGQRRRRRVLGFSLALAAAAAGAVMVDRQLVRHSSTATGPNQGSTADADSFDPDLRRDLDALRAGSPLAPVADWDRIEAPIHRYTIVLRKGGSP